MSGTGTLSILRKFTLAAAGEKSSIWTDIGSGGGLPGIVIATLTQGEDQQTNVTMVESDKRKSVFLRTAIRELGLSNAKVINERIENAQIPISGYRFGKGAGVANRSVHALRRGFQIRTQHSCFRREKTGLLKSKQLRIIGLLITMRLKVKQIAMR